MDGKFFGLLQSCNPISFCLNAWVLDGFSFRKAMFTRPATMLLEARLLISYFQSEIARCN